MIKDKKHPKHPSIGKGECAIMSCKDPITRKTILYGVRKDGSTYGHETHSCERHYYEFHLGLEQLVCKHCSKITIIKIGDYYGNGWDGKWGCPFCKKKNDEAKNEEK